MLVELWGNSLNEFCYLFDKEDITMMVYLEDHALINGIDVADMHILNNLFTKELFKNGKDVGMRDYLLNLSRGWFSLISCNNMYVNLVDYIVFNHKKKRFESLLDTYSNCAEKHVESYDEDFNAVIYSENEFNIAKEIEVNEDSQLILLETDYLEEYVYTIKNSENFLIVRDDLTHGVRMGLIVKEGELEEYIHEQKNKVYYLDF